MVVGMATQLEVSASIPISLSPPIQAQAKILGLQKKDRSYKMLAVRSTVGYYYYYYFLVFLDANK